jgi:hypothetical protein
MQDELFDAAYLKDADRAKIAALHADGVVVDWIAGICPLQATGVFDGHPFYFKARGHHWEFSVAPSVLDDALNAYEAVQFSQPGWWFYQESYERVDLPNAGYMPIADALVFIEWSARQYRLMVKQQEAHDETD